MTSPHHGVTTPLRRISRGSIPALRQSQSHANDPAGLDGASSYGPGGAHGGGAGSLLSSSSAGGLGAGGSADSPLAFMTAAMADLSHETSILQSNLEAVNSIHEALGVFDENFSMYMYGLKMNAFCVEWPEAPTEENFERADKTQDILRAQREQQSSILSGNPYTFYPSQEKASVSFEDGSIPGSGSYDQSEEQTPVKSTASATTGPSPGRAAASGSASSAPGKGAAAAPPSALKKAAPGKGQITVAQKKQRIKFATEIIETLPLEYRGGRDPKPRKIAETVILALIAAGPAGVRSAEIAAPPDLPQAKVNMTLLALVQAKHAIRTSSNGVVFSLDPARHPRLPP